MDEELPQYIRKFNLKNATIVPLSDFEKSDLLSVKNQRSIGEYCWTTTPYSIRDALNRFNLQEIVYLDADLYFFKSPQTLIEEWKNSQKSILLTEHRYSSRYDQTEKSGRFCVQFMGFKKDEIGSKALNWWTEKCLDWCYARVDQGRFGDQKYIEEFPNLFPSCHSLEHLGAGVAPWNIGNYEITQGPKVDNQNIIFYHFHSFKIYAFKKFELVDMLYSLSSSARKNIYEPYMNLIIEIQNQCSELLGRDITNKVYDPEKNTMVKRIKSLIKRKKHVVQR